MKLRIASFALLIGFALSAPASAAPWPPQNAGSVDARIHLIVQKVTEIIGQVSTLQTQVAAIVIPDLTPLEDAIAELQDRLQDVSRSGTELAVDGSFRVSHNLTTSNGITVELTNASNGMRGIEVTQAGVGPGVFATSEGGIALWGITNSISGAGALGDNEFGEAVVGRNEGGVGVGAVVGRNDGAGYGVRGFNTSTGIGVLGQGGVSGGTGPGGRFEVVNAASGANALEATTNGSGHAGLFTGNVRITGNLTVVGTVAKGGGAFQIDHPLDPENKFLSHSFVESPDMMNVYNGVIRLNDAGEATVELPDWFEALNRDFRYQLTPVGAPGPNLFVSEEVSGNRFKIAGGKAGAKVSWQVTGIRHDRHANENRIQVEQDKPANLRGHLSDEVTDGGIKASIEALETAAQLPSGANLPR